MACGVATAGPVLNLALPLLCPHSEASTTVASAVYTLATARTEAFRAGVAALSPTRRAQLQEGLRKMQQQGAEVAAQAASSEAAVTEAREEVDKKPKKKKKDNGDTAPGEEPKKRKKKKKAIEEV
jgi:hypothetical protein